jgi:hypothetical protein
MWLYIPPDPTSPPSACAPAPAPLTSPSGLQFRRFARSCTSRGKHSALPTWWARSKRVSWLQRLYGQIPPASQADAFAAAWTSFLAASRASRTASPGRAAAPMTSATYGLTPAGSSFSPELGRCSSKTSAGCSATPAAANGYGESFAGWALKLRADSSRRRKLARPTTASGYSSSPFTPDAPTPLFPDEWPTPTERDHRSVYASDATRGHNSRPLSEAAGAWATPTIADTEGGRANRSGARAGELLLRGQAKVNRFRQDRMTEPPGEPSLALRPHLEPVFRRSPHGVAGRLYPDRGWPTTANSLRLDRLRLLGNGVVPLAAAYAFRTLADRLAARVPGAARLVRMTS